jgi:hypothetical protein
MKGTLCCLVLEYHDVDNLFVDKSKRSSLPKWKDLVAKEYLLREQNLTKAKKELSEATLVLEEAKQKIANSSETDNSELPDMEEAKEPCIPLLPPMFSAMCEPQGYNARFLSKSRIDSILATEYHYRKPAQLGKMYGLTAEILKIDSITSCQRKSEFGAGEESHSVLTRALSQYRMKMV